MPIEYTYRNYVDRIYEAVNIRYPNLKMSKGKVSRILNVINHMVVIQVSKGFGVYLFFCSIVPYYRIKKKKG